MDAVFEADPAEEGDGDGEVEEAFVRNCEDDEEGTESEESDGEAVEVVVARLQSVQEGYDERCDQRDPSYDLRAQWQSLLRLQGEDAGACDEHGESDESDLSTHDGARDAVWLLGCQAAAVRSSLNEHALLEEDVREADYHGDQATQHNEIGILDFVGR